MIESGKAELVEQHRQRNDHLVIITATNDFVTQPIAEMLGVEVLLATRAEIIDGAYTGKVAGTPCFQAGKITRLQQWLKTNPIEYKRSIFYSDSHNDIPLLEYVDEAIAVKPDEQLRAHAAEVHWKVID